MLRIVRTEQYMLKYPSPVREIQLYMKLFEVEKNLDLMYGSVLVGTM